MNDQEWMMCKVVLAVAFVFLFIVTAGCASTPRELTAEIAVGANVTRYTPWSQGRDGGFAGPSDTVRFSVRYDSGSRFCQASHTSHLSAGWPVNDASEDWLDVVECGVRFGGRK